MEALSLITQRPLDETSEVPLYRQLEGRLLSLIASHALDDEPLPTEKDLCTALGLSRATVRRCFEDLVEQGRVVRRRGRGTFVTRSTENGHADVSLNFTKRMEALGRVPTSRVLDLSTVPAHADLARWLGVAEGTELWRAERLRLADDVPMEHHVAFVPRALCPDLTKERLASSLYARIAEESGVLPATAEATIEAITLDEADAERLTARPGEAALRTRRITFDADGKPFEAVTILSRADHNRIIVHMGATASTFSTESF